LPINLRQRTCVIELPEIEGEITFFKGEIIAARQGEKEGPEAFFSILERGPSSFRLLAGGERSARNIYENTTRLLLDCARALDEKRFGSSESSSGSASSKSWGRSSIAPVGWRPT
jgi:hypothetical protein